jgi:hypothetical protein
MWRALALAIGISLCILGGECLLIDKAVLASSKPAASESTLGGGTAKDPKEIQPPEWAPWTLISMGAVVMLYSFTIPKRVGG